MLCLRKVRECQSVCYDEWTATKRRDRDACGCARVLFCAALDGRLSRFSRSHSLRAHRVAMAAAATSPSKRTRFREFNSEFDDLDPVITYRHMQSPVVGPRHPLRFIALCDCNAFYANCEQIRLGIDPAKPLVVLQWNALIAVNYPAREFGTSFRIGHGI